VKFEATCNPQLVTWRRKTPPSSAATRRSGPAIFTGADGFGYHCVGCPRLATEAVGFGDVSAHPASDAGGAVRGGHAEIDTASRWSLEKGLPGNRA